MNDVESLLAAVSEPACIFLKKSAIPRKDPGGAVFIRRSTGAGEVIGYFYRSHYTRILVRERS